LDGLTVIAFESRRSSEMAELIRRHAGTPIVAPSMREVPLEENRAAFAFLDALEKGSVDLIILLTGVGTRTLVAALAPTCSPERFAELLRQVTVFARGPKPVAALRELGLAPNLTAPEPNTWREILATLDAAGSVAGKRIAVQEYGVTNPELISGLETRGAEVMRVPVYLWALPEDTGPLRDGIRRLANGTVDIALFTSATQVYHVVQVGQEIGLARELVEAGARVVVGSIGPICSEALREHGLPVDLEPEHPKMGQLVSSMARRAKELVAAKRAGS
jgi:uroporphyrinogen-III synthase